MKSLKRILISIIVITVIILSFILLLNCPTKADESDDSSDSTAYHFQLDDNNQLV